MFFIYESRPNVTADAAAICVKSGNAVILRGGKEALSTNQALQSLTVGRGARRVGIASARRATCRDDRSRGGRPFFGDARIHRPRDSARRRSADSRVSPPRPRCRSSSISPATATSMSIAADLDMAERIVVNSKCQRPGRLQRGRVAARCTPTWPNVSAADRRHSGGRAASRCAATNGRGRSFPAAAPATEEDYRTEFLGPDPLGQRWSTRWTRRSSTSTGTARSTPTRS